MHMNMHAKSVFMRHNGELLDANTFRFICGGSISLREHYGFEEGRNCFCSTDMLP